MMNLNYPKLNINFLLNTGGIGDNIAALPAMQFIRKNYPWVTPYLYVPDYFLPVARNMIPDMVIRPFSKGEKMFNGSWIGRQTLLKGHDSLATHLVDYNFHALCNRQVPDADKNYLSLNLNWIHTEKFKLPKDYVCIATGYTAPIRKFPGHTVNEIVDYLAKRNIAVVFLGSKQAETGGSVSDIISNFPLDVDYSKGINLVDKTSLLEAGKIIAGSKALVAVDCGLMHIAGCTEAPIIGGYTSVDPVMRMPYRHDKLGWNVYKVEPPNSEPEKYFQSQLDFIYNKDFKFSWLENENLVNSLTAQMFIEQLEKVLENTSSDNVVSGT